MVVRVPVNSVNHCVDIKHYCVGRQDGKHDTGASSGRLFTHSAPIGLYPITVYIGCNAINANAGEDFLNIS